MQRIQIHTTVQKLLADVYTPVGIYLRLRDRFRDTILLESTDHHAQENSYSFICVNAIGGIELLEQDLLEFKYPGCAPQTKPLHSKQDVPLVVWEFMQSFQVEEPEVKEGAFAQGLYGYTSFDAVPYFETISLEKKSIQGIGKLRYRLYQYVIAINHHKDELFICSNHVDGVADQLPLLESLIRGKDVPVYPFRTVGSEISNMSDDAYRAMVEKGIRSCKRGDVFQIVLSRRFQQGFQGDEFNVYRSLRNINPSPYLFFFDYGDYKLMGSSPEAQIVIRNGSATVHPIAGTFKRSGKDETDRLMADALLKDPKENAEHVMLVDLARNDLSRVCDEVRVEKYKEVQYYSHVIHLVSEVTGKVPEQTNPFLLLAKTFPAGTLSGAPKFKAMELIEALEPTGRGYYGGAIGFVGFDGSCNHAIMIRTFLSRENTLYYQAGAGVVVASVPENELQEVHNKLGALKRAIYAAESIY
jgi:anthranilate synthase component 1